LAGEKDAYAPALLLRALSACAVTVEYDWFSAVSGCRLLLAVR
jgi:hypothetical protein